MGTRREGRPDPRAPTGRHAAVEIGRLTGLDPDRRGRDRLAPVPERSDPPAPAGHEGLRIEVRSGPPARVHVAGDLDLHTAAELADRLDELDTGDVIVDCEDLRFVDSIGVSLLVRMHHELRARGRTLSLRNVSGVPKRTLEILGLTEALGVTEV